MLHMIIYLTVMLGRHNAHTTLTHVRTHERVNSI
jgi:hypothetical protein